MPQITNDAGVNLIKSFEGIMDGDPQTVNLDPYLDPVDIWTIGWGHVVRDEYGRPIKGRENREAAFRRWPGGISLRQAEELLRKDLIFTENRVARHIKVPLNSNQFSALVSWDFNTGGVSDSTLTEWLNAGDYDGVPIQLRRWNKGKVNGVLTEMRGLTRRREAEIELWNTPV